MTSRVIFCDWTIESDKFERCSLFNLTDLNGHKVIFFDPLVFALNNGLRKNASDLWARENISFIESRFQQFISKVKAATDRIRDFIGNGGIFVVRSSLPNSHITVRKKSSSSSKQYVTSVVSPFFWLEEFIGKYSFQHAKESKLRFLDNNNILNHFLKNTAIECNQTQNVIPRGTVNVLADNGKQTRLPIITRVSFPPQKGELYFIPKFLLNGEDQILAEAFMKIAEASAHRLLKPKWLGDYEKELALANPYISALGEVNREIGQLEKTRQSLIEKSRETEIYTELLYKSGDELLSVAKKTFRLMGFFSPEPPSSIAKAGFDFYYRDKHAFHIAGCVVSSLKGPIPFDTFERFADKIRGCKTSEPLKGILVANANMSKDPSQRGSWFADEILENSRGDEICLLTTAELFIIACYLLGKSDSLTGNAIKESLRKDLLECDSVFSLNRKKFYARR